MPRVLRRLDHVFKLPSLKLIEGMNQKGLFTYGGIPKPAAVTVAKLYKALPAN